MLGRLFGRGGAAADSNALPAPRKRTHGVYRLRALGDSRVRALEEAAAGGGWAAVEDALAPFDADRDIRVLDRLVAVDGVEEWIGRAVEEAGDDEERRATALLISGARHVEWGWEARTSRRAAEVTRDQWRVFGERLEIAEAQLLEAAELRPGWIAPWRWLLVAGRGASLGPVVAEARFDAAVRRDPFEPVCHVERLAQLQPRWGGAPGEGLAFAREAAARAPEGHPLGALVALAHIEDWVESDAVDCLETDAVRADLLAAAERSVFHPAYQRQLGWQIELNAFALAFCLAGAAHRARRIFHDLDGAMAGAAWNYFAEPEKRYAAFRRDA